MMDLIPSSARRILEVGCGEGEFGAQLKASGREVWGMEYQAVPASRARERLDRVLEGDAVAALPAIPDNRFDCVVLNDFLEHIVDPWTFVRDLRRVLAPGGCIVASVPNVRYFRVLAKLLFKREWRYVEEGVLDRTHLRFFTSKDAQRLFVENGLQVEVLRGINPPSRFKSRLPAHILSLATLGAWSDVQYRQFAIRAVLPEAR